MPPRRAQISYTIIPTTLGGLNLATRGDGTLVETATYYPFGENNEGSDSGIKYKFTGQEKDIDIGLYNYGARFYDPVPGRFISPDSFVQAPGDPQTLNRYAYCRNNPLVYTDPTGHFFIFDDLIEIGILIGAALGATTAAISGGNIGLGALTGAISGAFFAGAGIIGEGLDSVVQAGIHAAAGAMSGAINAGITGGNVWQSAAISGVSSGVAKYAMAGILPKASFYQNAGDWAKVGMQGATAVATGTVMGGVSSVKMGESFGTGPARR